MRSPDSLPILIVGAGPTGLVLALSLARRGVPFRLIDRATGPGLASRALAVHARTLEFYRQFGLADAAIAAGTRIRHVHILDDGREIGGFALESPGESLSPYPFVLDLPQDEHEVLLGSELSKLGIPIEWSTELTGFTDTGDMVSAQLAGPGGPETAIFGWLCGCDGAHSRVREALDMRFDGGTYPNLYYVADVKLAAGDSHDLHLAIGTGSFALRMPSRQGAMQRLIGIAPERADGSEPGFDDIRAIVEPLLAIRVDTVNWFSTYRVHHRVAAHFRAGRVFLAGDAGHLHSPAGGQGMNTGIGDAINLGWKLGAVWHGRAPETLLDSYEPERIAFARTLVATTDRVFQAVVSGGLLGKVVRGFVMPHVLPAIAGLGAGRRALFRTMSQIAIAYPDSPLSEGRAGALAALSEGRAGALAVLSEGRAGALAAGDRLPWVAAADNFAPLQSLDWQLHIHGTPAPPLIAAAAALSLPVHSFAAAPEVGLADGTAWLVRPDGHLALALPDQDPAVLGRYVARHGLAFGGAWPGATPQSSTGVNSRASSISRIGTPSRIG